MTELFKNLGSRLECYICPHYCKISEGNSGICGVRKNTGGKFELITYGVISGCGADPIEKKPLYHFFPGTNILSVGSYGCNLSCDFCQNYHISQNVPLSFSRLKAPEEMSALAFKTGNNLGIAFTYNEPAIWFEYMRDTAVSVKNYGMYTAMISNGFVNTPVLNEIIQFIDAFNIDLKAFNNDFYKRLTRSDINPVKECIKKISKSGKHLEITTLIIPGQNDSSSEMKQEVAWIADEIGKNVPLHLSRYYPVYNRKDPPTPDDTLRKLADIASEKLEYVYIGNTNSPTYQNTNCPGCGTCVTKRSGYNVTLQNLDDKGNCLKCRKPIYKYFISTI
jgi:pyruvate formate lyase activating enzyme